MKSSSLKFLIISCFSLITLLIAKYPPIISYLYETTNFFPALCFRLYALLLAFLLFISFYGVGSFFCPIVKLNRIPQNLKIPVYFFIGFFFSSSIVYFLGFLGIIKKEILICIIFLGIILTIKEMKLIPQNLLSNFRSPQKGIFEKIIWFFIVIFLIGRLFPVLNFNSFGDPLFYSLPVGRDYLKVEGFKWFENAEFYWQAGLSDIGLIYLHSLTSHPMLTQLSAQAFYYITGTLFLIHILHKGFFSKLIPNKHSLWITFSFIAMDTFRLESIVAKSDYWLAVILCLILVCLYEFLDYGNEKNRMIFCKLMMLLAALCMTIKPTSIFFLIPIGTSILIFGLNKKNFNSISFWLTLSMALLLSLLNFAKNHYIFGSPSIPFAEEIFPSPYWDKEGYEGIRKLGQLEKGDLSKIPNVLLNFFLGHPASLFLVIFSIFCLKKEKLFQKFPAPLKNYLNILSFSWVCGLLLWIILLDPEVNTRYLIGFVFLTLIIVVTISILICRQIFFDVHSKLNNIIVIIGLFLTLSVSHIDVDFQNAKQWISNDSFHQQWLNNNDLAKVQNFLNSITFEDSRVLFFYTTQRFHANFIVFGARSFSPRTRFVYSSDVNEVKKGLRTIRPNYFVIRKDKVKNTQFLLSNKDFLDTNFILLKNFDEYLIYKIPKSILL